MFAKITRNIHQIAKFSSSDATKNVSKKWDLLAAICVERKPVIVSEPNNIEKEYMKHLSTIELTRSLKSDHELRHETEVKILEKLKTGEVDADTGLKETAQDFADASLEELNTFKFAQPPQETNLQSLQRKLDKNLVLVLKQKIGDKDFYLLPQGVRQDGETLRQTAERVLQGSLGGDLKAQIYGNAPAGFYKYKYPKNIRDKTVGAKVFIYFARHLNGGVTQKGADFQWLDRQELAAILPQSYKESVQEILIDE